MTATADSPAALEELVPLRTLAAMLPRRRGGKKTHVATVYRWTDPGLRGVRLRYVQVGDIRCSTVAWAYEFFERLAAPQGGAPAPVRTPAARERAVAKADRELEKMGI